MPLVNCEIILILTWSANCAEKLFTIDQAKTFSITDAKLCVPLITSTSTEDNVKLLQQLKSGFKRTINCSKYQCKITKEALNQYLDYLIDQAVNTIFVLTFEDNVHQTIATDTFS